MRINVLVLIGLLGLTGTGLAQQPGNTCPPPRSLQLSADSARPDIAIVARVQAAELRFNAQPQASLQLFGCPQVDTSLVVMRTNLPTPVQPGVTYRNVIVDFRLNMKFAELECYITGHTCPVRQDSIKRRQQ